MMRVFRGLSALWPIIILAAAVGLAIPAAAATITVDTANDEPLADPDNGNCTLREAVDAANSDAAVDGCSAGSGADLIQFQGNYTITFAEGEMPVNDQITIDGTGFTVTLQGNGSERGFVLAVATSNLALSNLSVNDFVLSAGSGGAVFVNAGEADFSATNVTFDGNAASTGSGGAIWSTGDVALTDVVFTGNSADGDGGAVYVSGALAVTNGVFGIFPVPTSGNTAGGNGGAIYAIIPQLASGGTAALTNVEFYGNEAQASGAEKGGGAIFLDTDGTSQVSVVNCAFLSNTASAGAGGAILATFGSNIAYVDPALPFAFGISRSHFESNVAGGSTTDQDSSGGAIYNRGRMTIVASSFIGNSSTNSAGGAISHNGTSDALLTLANVTLNDNTADTNGGAIANLNASTSRVEIINCTIAGNTANGTGATPGGGAIYNLNTTPAEFTVTTSIISDNLTGSTDDNCAGTAIGDGGFNIQWPNNDCGGTINVGDPNLGAAFLNGLPANPFVWVMEIQDVSAAAGAGSNAVCGDALVGPIIALDARGVPRPASSGVCDAGAYESDLVPVELMGLTVD